MQDVFDIYTIIFLALAVFIFLRLRSVLGQRTGRERPPYDPYSSAREPVRPAADNVVALPGPRAETAAEPAEPAAAAESVPASERWNGIAAARLADCRRARRRSSPRTRASTPKHFHHRRPRRLRDDRHRLCRGRPPHASRTCCRARSMTASRRRSPSARSAAKPPRAEFVAIDKADITAAELRGKHRADHRALHLAAGFGHARPERQRDRRQCRKR